MAKNIIELNGNTYDVRTGKLISMKQSGDVDGPSVNTAQQVQPTAQSSMDFYHRKKATDRTSQPTGQPADKSKALKKSKTLMRTAVSKPSLTQPAQEKKDLLKPRTSTNFARLERATKSVKSNVVKKFHAPATASNRQAQANSLNKPAMNAPQGTDNAQSAKRQPQGNTKPEAPVATPSLAASALEYATGHEQTFEPKKGFLARTAERLQQSSTKTKYALAGVVAFGGLAFLGYAFAPVVSVQLASNRSGVAASIPSYKPSGFQLNRTVEYSPGQVALQYESLTDSRNFQIKKQSTDWTSDALKNNFVEDKGLYQTVTSKGKTIYIYNGSNATWVDGGIWYTIDGASSLNSDQLLRIVDSL